MLHGTRKRISRVCLTAITVAVAAASRTASPADAPALFPAPMSGGEIELALQKLNVLGRVLYLAAHPDDENTNLMAFWANGSLYETAYLSITRGDGGQNLIGPELRERLGIIRTEELLAARRLDHAQQFFSRAFRIFKDGGGDPANLGSRQDSFRRGLGDSEVSARCGGDAF